VALLHPSLELVGPSEAWMGGMPVRGEGGELGQLGSKTLLNIHEGIHTQKM
jgi:hypothetical protein